LKQAYTAFDPNASHLSWAFYTEVKKLWQADKSTDSVICVAALMNLASAGANNGHDQEGEQFLNVAQGMMERLGLEEDITGPAEIRPNIEHTHIGKDLRFRSHIVWGYFVIVRWAFIRTSAQPIR